MRKLSRIDWSFLLLLVVVLALLFLGTGKKLGPDVPSDGEHLGFYQQLDHGGDRIDVEKGCQACHEKTSLPANHPHKEECMVCHRPK